MNKTVLIVDDSSVIRTLLKEILDEVDITVIGEAPDGVQGVEMYKELKPNLVTMDINMPEKGGMEALKEIIEFDKNANVIICTAMIKHELVYEAFRQGAKDYLIKPYKKDQVLGVIEKIFSPEPQSQN